MSDEYTERINATHRLTEQPVKSIPVVGFSHDGIQPEPSTCLHLIAENLVSSCDVVDAIFWPFCTLVQAVTAIMIPVNDR